MAGSLRKPAGASFAGALTLADRISAEPIVLFAYAAGGQEAFTAGLLSITAAQGLFPRFQQAETGRESTLPRVQPPFLL